MKHLILENARLSHDLYARGSLFPMFDNEA